MALWKMCLASLVTASMLAFGVWAAGPTPAKPKLDDLSLHNAALASNGGHITLTLGPGTKMNRETDAEMLIDGNVHTRAVLEGGPYTIRIDLVDKLPISEIALCNTDYAADESPKDVEIKLSDGTVMAKTLNGDHPAAKQKLRQVIAINKDLSWVEIKVLNHQPGQPGPDGKLASFGGFGEVEIITTADLSKYTTMADYNPAGPVYVDARYPRADYANVKVAMPAKVPLGQHPSLYLTRDEFVKLRETLKNSVRGKPIMDGFIALANKAEAFKVEFPDPSIPAQVKDRGDAPAKAHDLLSVMAGRFGYAYQLTDNEACARKVREILVGYAKLYPNAYVEHKGVERNDTSKVMAQRLSEATWLLSLIQSYDCIYNSPCLSDDDRKLIENDLFKTAIAFINAKRDGATEVAARDKADGNWRTAEPKPGKAYNWTNFYNAAYIQAGIVTRDQNWIDIGAANTRYNIVRGIGDDGMWGEGAIGYQQFALMALVDCLEPLARQGIDLYSYDKCRVKNMWDSAFNYAYPDRTAPGINDSTRGHVAGGYQAAVYDYAWLRYGDPQYAPLVNEAPRQIIQSQGEYFPTVIYDLLPVAANLPPPGIQTSLVFDSLGYNIMRGSDHGLPTYLLLKSSQPSGPHSHPDKLNLIVYAGGDELAGEPEFYRYEDRRHPEWTKTTIAHFTLSVDEHDQTEAGATLLAYSDGGAVKAMRAQCATAYPGVLMDRTVVQMPGYIVDVFRANSMTSHTYDYPLCFRGALDASADVNGTEKLPPLGQARGYCNLFVAKTFANTADDWKGTWKRSAIAAVPAEDAEKAVAARPATEVNVTLLGAPATTVHICRDVDQRDRAIVRRSGKEAIFASIINPYKGDNAVAAVESLKVDGPVPATGLRVKRTDGGQDLIIVRFDPQTGGKLAGESTFDGGRTNALITVLRLDAGGKLLTPSGYLGGTSATCAGSTISGDTPGIKWTK